MSVPGVAALPATSPGTENGFLRDAGLFGALLAQQASPQPLTPMAGSADTPSELPPPADGEAVSVDGGEADMPLVLPAVPDIDRGPGHGLASDATHGAPPSGADKVQRTHDAPPPIAGDATILPEATPVPAPQPIKLSVATDEPDERTDVVSPPVDEDAIDLSGTSDMPLVPVPVPDRALPSGPVSTLPPHANLGSAEPAASPDDDADRGDGVARDEPGVGALQGHDRSRVQATLAPEASRGEDAPAVSTTPHPIHAEAGGAPADAAGVSVITDKGEGGLPSPLLTQAMPAIAAKPATSPYPPATHLAPHQPVVKAQEGAFGGQVGTEIAKVAKAGRDDLLIRLDPRELGRVDVRLSFDHDGVLRAVLSADSPAALDMLRRESGELKSALADAGIRADGQSLRFDARSGGQGAGMGDTGGRDPQQRGGSGPRGDIADDSVTDISNPAYRSLRASGHVDLMA